MSPSDPSCKQLYPRKYIPQSETCQARRWVRLPRPHTIRAVWVRVDIPGLVCTGPVLQRLPDPKMPTNCTSCPGRTGNRSHLRNSSTSRAVWELLQLTNSNCSVGARINTTPVCAAKRRLPIPPMFRYLTHLPVEPPT